MIFKIKKLISANEYQLFIDISFADILNIHVSVSWRNNINFKTYLENNRHFHIRLISNLLLLILKKSYIYYMYIIDFIFIPSVLKDDKSVL